MKKDDLDNFIEEQMKSPAFKKAWHNLDSEFELLGSMIEAREKANISQAELADKIGTKQPALSRLEKGGYKKATFETLEKIADALGFRISIRLEPKHS